LHTCVISIFRRLREEDSRPAWATYPDPVSKTKIKAKKSTESK
jgi:hypothetical protein